MNIMNYIMITTFKELKTYISMDLNNSGRTYKTKIDYFRDEISRYLIYLRIREYVYIRLSNYE